jgi:hypothetical protein
MSERQPVSITIQVILCFIPLVWLYGFYRIEKLGAGILMVIGVAILAIVLAFIPVFGYALAWLASFLLPIYYMVKWSQEWNEDIAIERENEERDTNEEDDDTETRYRLD